MAENSQIVPHRTEWPAVPIRAEQPANIKIRLGEERDQAFVDHCQKLFKGNLGFLYTGTIEKKISRGEILVAVDQADAYLGYCMGTLSYDRNDAVSRIDQIAVVPARQRRQLGSVLLREWISRLPYGVKLICCWCAQDLRENRFWEAEGFIPLAFRAGGQSQRRIHIFWERRTRAGDVKTEFWYPKETSNGAMSASRLILPIPPGVDWREADLPRIVPQGDDAAEPGLLDGPVTAKQLADQANAKAKRLPGPSQQAQQKRLTPAQYQERLRQRSKHLQPRGPVSPAIVGRQDEKQQPAERDAPKKPTKPRPKNLPEHVAAARELRDRYLEQLNEQRIEETGKYDPTRQIDATPTQTSRLATDMMKQLEHRPDE